MHKIIGMRGSGKTTTLIQKCAADNGQMVCFSKREAKRVFKTAEKMGAVIKYPYTFHDIMTRDRKTICRGVYNLYIDNADMILQDMLREYKIKCITMNNESNVTILDSLYRRILMRFKRYSKQYIIKLDKRNII